MRNSVKGTLGDHLVFFLREMLFAICETLLYRTETIYLYVTWIGESFGSSKTYNALKPECGVEIDHCKKKNKNCSKGDRIFNPVFYYW